MENNLQKIQNKFPELSISKIGQGTGIDGSVMSRLFRDGIKASYRAKQIFDALQAFEKRLKKELKKINYLNLID